MSHKTKSILLEAAAKVTDASLKEDLLHTAEYVGIMADFANAVNTRFIRMYLQANRVFAYATFAI
jgi:hypothetical protein